MPNADVCHPVNVVVRLVEETELQCLHCSVDCIDCVWSVMTNRVTAKVRSWWARRCRRSSTGRESLSSGRQTSTSSRTSVTRTVGLLSGTSSSFHLHRLRFNVLGDNILTYWKYNFGYRLWQMRALNVIFLLIYDNRVINCRAAAWPWLFVALLY